MSIYVALLRGINVGGRNLITMADLRDLFEGLGFAGVQSLLQSGNLVFRSNHTPGDTLERLLRSESEKRWQRSIDYFVRTAQEWETIVARNPFPDEAESDPSHLVVLFMEQAPDAKGVAALRAAINGPEVVRVVGKQVYVVYPAGIGRSKLTSTLIEQKLGSRGTGQNWNTIRKLAAIIEEQKVAPPPNNE
jgi:uncharacterized protein (DUF1697 family)